MQKPTAGGGACEIQQDFETGTFAGSGWGDETGSTWTINSGGSGDLANASGGDTLYAAKYETAALTNSACEWACAQVVTATNDIPMLWLRMTDTEDGDDSYMMGVRFDGTNDVFLFDLVDNANQSSVQTEYNGCSDATTSVPDVECYQVCGTGSSTSHKFWLNPTGCDTAANCCANYTTWSATTPNCSVTNSSCVTGCTGSPGFTASAAQDTGKYIGVHSWNQMTVEWYVSGSTP